MTITTHQRAELRRLLMDAALPRLDALADGNQYIGTKHMPTARCVSAYRIVGLTRAWNPHSFIAFGHGADEHECVRLPEAAAKAVTAAVNNLGPLLDALDERERRVKELEGEVRAANRLAEIRADALRRTQNELDILRGEED